MKKLSIGLTGGIACGKTTVSNYFKKLGANIIDADLIAKNLVNNESDNLAKIKDYFGELVLLEDGNLNRSLLKEIIFKNINHKKWLENLLHPQVRAKIRELINVKTTKPYNIIVIPLLKNRLDYPYLQRILVIDSTKKQQIVRIKRRDNINQQLIENIINSQLSRQKKLDIADDIIYNNNSIKELLQKINTLHLKYKSLST